MEQVIAPDWRALNATHRDILVALALAEPRSNRELCHALGKPESWDGQMYNNLAELRNRGFVTTNNRGRGSQNEKLDATRGRSRTVGRPV